MAYTGTLPPKSAQDTAVPRLSRPASKAAAAAVVDTGEQGKLAYFLLLLFTFILLGRPQDFLFPRVYVPIAILIGAPAILLGAVGLFTGQIHFRKSRELNLVLALTAWFVIGLPFAFWRGNTFDQLRTEWIKVVMIFILLTQLVTTLKRVRDLLWVIFLSGLVATGLSLALGVDLMADESRFMGLTRGFFSGNYLGIAASVLLPYIAAMLVHTKSLFKQFLLIGCFGSMVYMAVLTASRGNILSILMSLILVWFVVLRDSLKARLIGVFFAVGLVGSVVFAPHSFWERVSTLWDPQSFATSSVGNSASQSEFQRKELLMRSLYVTATKPIFGLGIGNFPIYSGTVTGNAQEWKGTHNTYTQISSETGIPGLAMYVTLLVTIILSMRKLARKCRDNPDLGQLRALANATIVSIVAFMVGACFAHLGYEYYLYYLAGIGVSLQNVYAIQTGTNLTPVAATNGKEKHSAWRRLGQSRREARA